MIRDVSLWGLCVLALFALTVAQIEDNKVETVPIEAVISFPERLEENEFGTSGFVKQTDEGIILYQSENDYQYDTRENSVFIRDVDGVLKKDNVEIVDGEESGGWEIYNLRVENGQITGDLLSEVSNNGEKLPLMPYHEGGKTENVSIYRLFGNPWAYNGRNVRFEAVLGYDTYESENSTTVIFSADEIKEGVLEERAKEYNLNLYEVLGIPKIEGVRVYLSGRMSIFLNLPYGMSELTDFEYHEKVVQDLDKYVEDYRKKMEERRNK